MKSGGRIIICPVSISKSQRHVTNDVFIAIFPRVIGKELCREGCSFRFLSSVKSVMC